MRHHSRQHRSRSRRPNSPGPLAAGALALTLLLGGGCSGPMPRGGDQPAADAQRVDQLADWLTGSFSSAAQAAADPENYFDIRLEVVPIWPERDDGRWLYVEQAAAGVLDRPYRQRVYRVRAVEPGVYESVVYTLPGEGQDWAGAWRTPQRFDAIGPDDLDERDGCAVVMRWKPDHPTAASADAAGAFVGGTVGTSCASNLRGADYATSEVVILPDRLLTWDRGFTDAGEQVWGATSGGYVFRRVR